MRINKNEKEEVTRRSSKLCCRMSFIIIVHIFPYYCLGYYVNKNEMTRICSMNEGYEKCIHKFKTIWKI